MSTITISVNEELLAFAEQEAAQRGCGDASDFVRSLLQNAAEMADLQRKLQEGEDEIARGEFSEWKPGDFEKEVKAMLKEKRGVEL